LEVKVIGARDLKGVPPGAALYVTISLLSDGGEDDLRNQNAETTFEVLPRRTDRSALPE
jgi:hypothetical protein